MADTQVSKTCKSNILCEFKSRPGHYFSCNKPAMRKNLILLLGLSVYCFLLV